MKYKFPLAPRQIDAMCLLGDHQGITAAQFAALFWPEIRGTPRKKPARLAAEFLGRLLLMGLLRKRGDPPNFRLGGPIKPRIVYFFTALGYEVYEYWRRQRH